MVARSPSPTSLGAWQATTSLPGGSYRLAAEALDGYLYVMGGDNSNNTSQAAVYYIKINSDGSLGSSWQTASHPLPAPRADPSSAVYNGYLYVMGGDASGSTGTDTTYYAKIQSNGDIGSWQSTSSFANTRYGAGAVAYAGYLYLIGGEAYEGSGWDATPVSYADAQYAKINSDGSLASWQMAGSLPVPTGYGGETRAFVSNGYVYAAATEPSSTVYTASIHGNGSLSTWQYNTLFGGGDLLYYSLAFYSGYVYILGGANSGTPAPTQYAQLNSIARVGMYSKLIDLGAATTVTSISYSGGLPPTRGSAVIYRAAGANGIFGAQIPLSDMGAGVTARYILVNFTLDDSTTAVFPDRSGAATVTDFTVTYAAVSTHPRPDQRLQQGKTLQNGVLSPFDTTGP